jgi:nucleotide-binding universal stress UspA family protein
MNEIVVGVDGSEHSAAALRWAEEEATLRGEPLVPVLVWAFLDQHHPDGQVYFDADYDDDDARVALSSYVASAIGEDAEVELRVVSDRAARGLVSAAEAASMLVVGARGLGGFKSLLLGSVSQSCLHHAPCPVAIVRAGMAPHPSNERFRVVVGVDGSGPSDAALRWAADEAERRDADLVVVHSWQLPITGPYPYMVSSSEVPRYEADAQRLLDEIVDGLSTRRPAERVLHLGSPAGGVLEAGALADVIVVGARGAGGMERLLLGSTSTQVVHHAPCPVVVVPSPRSAP